MTTYHTQVIGSTVKNNNTELAAIINNFKPSTDCVYDLTLLFVDALKLEGESQEYDEALTLGQMIAAMAVTCKSCCLFAYGNFYLGNTKEDIHNFESADWEEEIYIEIFDASKLIA